MVRTTKKARPVAASPTRLRVATWNCYGAIGSLQGMLLGRPRWPERFISTHLARSLGAWDLVCIQENFVPFVHAALEEIAHEAQMYLWTEDARPGAMRGRVFGGGLALLSRVPPLSVTFVQYEGQMHGFDGYSGKGYAVADFATPTGGRFRLVNTHLQSDDPAFGIEASQRVRGRQLRALFDALSSNVPTIIAGDLNVPHGSDDHRTHLAPLLRARSVVDCAEGQSLITYDTVTNDLLRATDPQEPASRLDYVLTSDGGGLRWTQMAPARLILHDPLDLPLGGGRGRMFASDHYGLGVSVALIR